jgi:hypothetical protein
MNPAKFKLTACLAFAILALLSSCSEDEVKPGNNNDALIEYELDFQSVNHEIFDIEVAYGVNKLGTPVIMKNNAIFNVYIKKGDAIHVRITQMKSPMTVLIAPDHYTFVPYNLTLNETLIVEYSEDQFK